MLAIFTTCSLPIDFFLVDCLFSMSTELITYAELPLKDRLSESNTKKITYAQGSQIRNWSSIS